MLVDPNKLLHLCNLFLKKANLEQDMAKRIMLSIMPSVMNSTERVSTLADPEFWGVDYNALRSASLGAKDLLKYGTAICVDEVKYYGKPLKDIINQTFNQNKKEKLSSLLAETTAKINEARDLEHLKRYTEALRVCVECFQDDEERNLDTEDGPLRLSLWDMAYGGESWARIARNLHEIGIRWGELEKIKRGEFKPEDKLKREVQLMKELIVLMNVFDGLAHNTGSVMPKLIEKEVHMGGVQLPWDGRSQDDKIKEYQNTIVRLMDSKELDNPLEVYKEVEHIMSSAPYKGIFRDWIERLMRHPGYQTVSDKTKRDDKINRIRQKKLLIDDFGTSIQYAYNMMNKFHKNYLKAVESNDFTGIKISLKTMYSNLDWMCIQEMSDFKEKLERKITLSNDLNEYDAGIWRETVQRFIRTNNELIEKTNSFKDRLNIFYYAMENISSPTLKNVYVSTVRSSHLPEIEKFLGEIQHIIRKLQSELGEL